MPRRPSDALIATIAERGLTRISVPAEHAAALQQLLWCVWFVALTRANGNYPNDPTGLINATRKTTTYDQYCISLVSTER